VTASTITIFFFGLAGAWWSKQALTYRSTWSSYARGEDLEVFGAKALIQPQQPGQLIAC
jgi:hypothetical protein